LEAQTLTAYLMNVESGMGGNGNNPGQGGEAIFKVTEKLQANEITLTKNNGKLTFDVRTLDVTNGDTELKLDNTNTNDVKIGTVNLGDQTLTITSANNGGILISALDVTKDGTLMLKNTDANNVKISNAELDDKALTIDGIGSVEINKVSMDGTSTFEFAGSATVNIDEVTIKGTSTFEINSAGTVNIKEIDLEQNSMLEISGTGNVDFSLIALSGGSTLKLENGPDNVTMGTLSLGSTNGTIENGGSQQLDMTMTKIEFNVENRNDGDTMLTVTSTSSSDGAKVNIVKFGFTGNLQLGVNESLTLVTSADGLTVLDSKGDPWTDETEEVFEYGGSWYQYVLSTDMKTLSIIKLCTGNECNETQESSGNTNNKNSGNANNKNSGNTNNKNSGNTKEWLKNNFPNFS